MALPRSFLTLVFMLAALALVGNNATAQEPNGVWQALGGPLGAATLVAADPAAPDFVFVFVTQAVSRNNDRTQAATGAADQSWASYFSTDGGRVLETGQQRLAHAEPTTLAILPYGGNSTIWVGTAEDGLWRSDNGGRTWRPVLVRGLENQRVLSLSQDGRGGLHMLAVDNTRYPDSYLYSSEDGGFNWVRRVLQRYNATPAAYPIDVAADPFQPGRLYVPTLGGLLYTDNGGVTWRQSPVPVPDGALPEGDTVLAVDPTQHAVGCFWQCVTPRQTAATC